MLSDSHKALFRSHGTLVGRVLLGLLFVFSAVGMFMNGVDATASYFSAAGVPMAGIAVWIVLAVKIIGGGALILGIKAEDAALALILFTLGATWFGHMHPFDSIAVFKNLSIIGGLLYVVAYGAGSGWKLR